jgi:hypothetical protein
MDSTYANCPNIRGNAYFYSNRISEVGNCFKGRNTSNRLNIYVHSGTTSNTSLKTTNNKSLFGATVTWTTDSTNNCYYNTSYNTYVYYVTNVAAAKEANVVLVGKHR